MQIDTGELRDRGLFRKRTKKKDAYGNPIDSTDSAAWQPMGSYWLKLKTLSNRNVAIGKGFSALVNFEVLIRYRPEINNDCQVCINNTEYQIDGVIHDPNKNYSQLFLSKLTN